MRDDKLATALTRLEAWAELLLSRMDFWWLVMVNRVSSRRKSVRKVVYTLEVVWLSSAEPVGLGTLPTTDFTGSERRARRSGGMVVASQGKVKKKRYADFFE